MITLRRAEQRRHERLREQEDWLTFADTGLPDALPGALPEGFAALEVFREGRLAPRAAFAQPLEAAEIVTYVREGTLGYEDSTGWTGLLRSGEFLRTSGVGAVHFSEANPSPKQATHVFQIRLRSLAGSPEPEREQKRFSAARRRGALCVVASPDAREGSLKLHQDVVVYSMLLDRGQHLVHPLGPGRGAWLHIVEGNVAIGDELMRTGDGAGIAGERSVSLTAIKATEVLVVDLVLPATS